MSVSVVRLSGEELAVLDLDPLESLQQRAEEAAGVPAGRLVLLDGCRGVELALPATLPVKDGTVMTMVAMPPLRILTASGGDHTVKIWDVESGNCAKTFEGNSAYVTSAA